MSILPFAFLLESKVNYKHLNYLGSITMYKNILIPIDGSDCSTHAVEQGVAFAKSIDATVTFLYAIEDPTKIAYSAAEVAVFSENLYDATKQAATESLATAKQLGSELGITVETRLIEREHPATAILEAEKEFDLVIMGTHGRRGIRHLFLGSVTEEVIRRATKPYMVIPIKTP